MYTIYFYEKRGGDMHPKLADTINYVAIGYAMQDVVCWLEQHNNNTVQIRKVRSADV